MEDLQDGDGDVHEEQMMEFGGSVAGGLRWWWTLVAE